MVSSPVGFDHMGKFCTTRKDHVQYGQLIIVHIHDWWRRRRGCVTTRTGASRRRGRSRTSECGKWTRPQPSSCSCGGYLDGQDVWYGLIARGSKGCREYAWLQGMAESEIRFKRVMKALLAYSLMVHDWCAETISRGGDELMVAAVKVVGAAVPGHSEAEYWVLQQRLLSHAERCGGQVKKISVPERIESVELSDAFHNLGLLYGVQGKLVEAEKIHRRALDGKEKALGRDHTSMLNTVNNLGLRYADQGVQHRAEDMFKRAFKGHNTLVGSHDEKTTGVLRAFLDLGINHHLKSQNILDLREGTADLSEPQTIGALTYSSMDADYAYQSMPRKINETLPQKLSVDDLDTSIFFKLNRTCQLLSNKNVRLECQPLHYWC